MQQAYDYLIIGSGFGGSVSALRLAEKGYKVLVVEKGKWYQGKDFAKTNYDLKKWLWMPFLRFHGIMKISFFRDINILSGVGVGGGSLVYASTLPIPKAAFYRSGSWGELNDWETELQPHYQTALRMLGAAQTPQLFDADHALKAVAKELGKEELYSPTKVGIYFGKADRATPDPFFGGEGPERTGCRYCGACMTGCPHGAKNSLDKNYLHLAQAKGAEILAEQEVVDVQPLGDQSGSEGYEITLRSSTKFFKKKRSIRAKGVIFSGGVLGSVKLMLQLKESSLPKLSDRLGHDIRTNNETLISVSTLDDQLDLSKGVAIGSILHPDDHSHLEVVRYGEGSNAWKWLHVPYSAVKNPIMRYLSTWRNLLSAPREYFKVYWKNSWAKKTTVLLFMQTLDSTLVFKRNWLGILSSRMGAGKKPTPFIPESVRMASLFAKQVKGKTTSFVAESVAGIPSTAHILGGAVMGKDRDSGVIDQNNRVFGYQNMYVIDGSMISANPGVNPSLSITAIAERAMAQIEPVEASESLATVVSQST